MNHKKHEQRARWRKRQACWYYPADGSPRVFYGWHGFTPPPGKRLTFGDLIMAAQRATDTWHAEMFYLYP